MEVTQELVPLQKTQPGVRLQVAQSVMDEQFPRGSWTVPSQIWPLFVCREPKNSNRNNRIDSKYKHRIPFPFSKGQSRVFLWHIWDMVTLLAWLAQYPQPGTLRQLGFVENRLQMSTGNSRTISKRVKAREMCLNKFNYLF